MNVSSLPCRTPITNAVQQGNDEGFVCIAPGEYWCQPELLPQAIQISLLIFLRHLKSRRTDVSINPVFHAEMFNHVAVKYMLPDLQSHIVQAFREGCQAWINTSLIRESSFITAAKIILKPILRPRLGLQKGTDCETREMGEALVWILAVNWGWMIHDEDVMSFLSQKPYHTVIKCVEHVVEALAAQWEEKLAAQAAVPV